MSLLKFRHSGVTFAVFCLISGAPSLADSHRAEEALGAYHAFLQARENAASLEDLFPYLPSRQVQRFNQVPPETLAMFSQSVLGPSGVEQQNRPKDDFELESYSIDGNEIDLQLTAENETGNARVLLQQQVTLLKEEDGWKIEDPRPKSWQVVGRLPLNEQESFSVPRPGPGRTDWPNVTIESADQFELIAEQTVSALDSPTKLRWDPNGRYVLVANNDQVALYALPELEPMWSGRAPSSFLGGTLSPDGRYYLSLAPLREPSRVDLALNARLGAPAEAPFFARVGLPTVRDSVGEVYRYDAEQYHPSKDVFAVAISGETADAIAFAGHGDTPPDLKVQAPEGVLVWAPDGSSFAYVNGFRQPGGTTALHAYPGGAPLHRLTAPGFSPGNILFSPDATKVANQGHDSDGPALVIWDFASGDQVATLNGLEQAAFGPDPGQIIGVRDDGVSVQEDISDTLVVLDFGSEDEVTRLAAFPKGDNTYPANISVIGVSPNGRYVGAVADVGDEYVIKVWEITAAE